MKVIEYSLKIGLVIEDVELLVVLTTFVKEPDIISYGADLVIEILIPEVRLELSHGGLVADNRFGHRFVFCNVGEIIFSMLVEVRMLGGFVKGKFGLLTVFKSKNDQVLVLEYRCPCAKILLFLIEEVLAEAFAARGFEEAGEDVVIDIIFGLGKKEAIT